MKKLLLLLSLVSVSVFANPVAIWEQISESDDGDVYSIDKSDISVAGDKGQWRHFMAGIYLKKPEKSPRGKTFRSIQSEWLVDCEKNYLQEGPEYYYNTKGKMVDKSMEWRPVRQVEAGTVREDYRDYVCK